MVRAAKPFITVSLLCLVLAASVPSTRADWVQDVTRGGERTFQAAFDGWTESE
jgi:hypothetical protein